MFNTNLEISASVFLDSSRGSGHWETTWTPDTQHGHDEAMGSVTMKREEGRGRERRRGRGREEEVHERVVTRCFSGKVIMGPRSLRKTRAVITVALGLSCLADSTWAILNNSTASLMMVTVTQSEPSQ
jgi:hypothetical protein